MALLNMDKDKIQNLIIDELSIALQTDPSSIDPNVEFLNLRVDSLAGIALIMNLEKKLKLELNPIMFWDYPTIHKLSEYLAKKSN